LFKKTDEYDNHVANRYDGMSGGRYLDAVLGIYLDGILSDEDIAPLSDDVRDFISRFK
jgi:hypothetical protein